MNEYALFHQLHNLKDLLHPFPAARETESQLEKALEQLSTKQYRVAVIGEFKRGKSSLINTLLGTQILPTDILPTTAVVNKIVYDTQQKIVLHYTDGHTEQTTIEELADYATKLDEGKAQRAAQLQQIVVHYPSVFCQNHIELIDTPGLNDDEAMTRKTISVLDKIDTAIVVISATMPLSMTEQRLICSLIEQPDIYHLTFVATFIDRVSDEPEEQDQVVRLLRRRLQEDTLNMFRQSHGENEVLLKKAEGILAEPKLFAVSSKLAMDGFIRGKKSLLEESRFPTFKIELLAQLTANQELDLRRKITRLTDTIARDFLQWAGAEAVDTQGKMEALRARINTICQCRDTRYHALHRELLEVDRALEATGFAMEPVGNLYYHAQIQPRQFFIRRLSAIRRSGYSPDAVRQALHDAMEETQQAMQALLSRQQTLLTARMAQVAEVIAARDRLCEIEIPMPPAPEGFPAFSLTEDLLLDSLPDLMGQIMPAVDRLLEKAASYLHRSVMAYLAAWRASLLRREHALQEPMGERIAELEKTFTELESAYTRQNTQAQAQNHTVQALLKAMQ